MKLFEEAIFFNYKTMKKNVSNFLGTIEKGDLVEVIEITERGYSIKHIESGFIVEECGWDIFE